MLEHDPACSISFALQMGVENCASLARCRVRVKMNICQEKNLRFVRFYPYCGPNATVISSSKARGSRRAAGDRVGGSGKTTRQAKKRTSKRAYKQNCRERGAKTGSRAGRIRAMPTLQETRTRQPVSGVRRAIGSDRRTPRVVLLPALRRALKRHRQSKAAALAARFGCRTLGRAVYAGAADGLAALATKTGGYRRPGSGPHSFSPDFGLRRLVGSEFQPAAAESAGDGPSFGVMRPVASIPVARNPMCREAAHPGHGVAVAHSMPSRRGASHQLAPQRLV